MISTGHAARSCLTIFCAALLTCALGVVVATPARAAERVLIWGKSTDSEHQPEFADKLQRDRENLCLVEGQIRMAWDQARLGIGEIVAELALPTDIEFQANDAFERAADATCRGEDIDLSYFTSSNFFLIYSHCSMFMRSTDAEGKDLGGLSIFLNESISEALMYFRDPETGKAYKVAINRDMKAARRPVAGEQEIFGAGRTTAANMERIGGPETFTLGRQWVIDEGGSDRLIDYEAYHYQYEYSSSLTGGMMGDAVKDASAYSGGQTPFASLGAMTKVTTTGTAWIAPKAPGVAIINTFYDNFARIVEGQQGAMSFIGGMLRNQAAITAKGIPLSSVVDTQSAMGMHSTSTFDALEIKVIPARVTECTAQPVPEGWTVTDLNEAMGTGGAGQPGMAGMSPQQQAEMDAAMKQASAAMQQMTPEQQKMMEQFGIGGAFGGAQAGSATSPAANPAALTAGAAANPAQAAGAPTVGASMPCSEALYSEDLTQMVVNHLEALGYSTADTGNGLSRDIRIQIAVSQFQAEHDLDPSGKVSAQLAGILSAKVDEACGK
jgi:hypothetical protein